MTPGTKLGPYEIIERIGQGGMGEVFRAHDPRLRRDVAIKVSAAQFSERFTREARAIAALNHPNICTLFDIGPNYLVMEYIEGATLQDRIKEGPVTMEETLAIARQMASALEAAHEKAIIHRDLKPANVKLTSTGIVKVLDFGLAKVAEPQEPMGENSPTLTLASATVAGTVLGTASYMAPEQARGKSVDKRADIWAFGVVVYELLTGSRLFQGETLADTLIDVASKHPDWEKIHPQALRLLQRCLEKDPQKRLRDIGDFALLLEEAPAAAVPVIVTPEPKRDVWPWAVAALGLIAAGVALWAPWRKAPEVPAVAFDIMPGKGDSYSPNHPLISPDGNMLALRVRTAGGFQMALRRLDSTDLRMLPDPDSGSAVFSPDGRWLLLPVGGKLRKMNVSGGPAETLGDVEIGSNIPWMAWGTAGVLVFPGPGLQLWRMPESGGKQEQATTLDPNRKERRNGVPQFLPDGKRFLFFAQSSDPEKSAMFAASIGDPPDKRTLVFPNQHSAFYARGPQGDEYLLFEREGALMATSFDSGSLKVSGEPFLVLPLVGFNNDHPFLTASSTGALVYSKIGTGSAQFQFSWLDRTGKKLNDVGPQGNWGWFSLSPDQQQIATSKAENNNTDVYLMDLAHGALPRRFTFDPAVDRYPLFSADSTKVLFSRDRKLFQKPIAGTATEQPLLDGVASLDWSRDGRSLLYTDAGNLWVMADGKKVQFTTTGNVRQGQFSPDGKWIVYGSAESAREEVWMQPYPATGAKFQISPSGGSAARWRGDGKELFYLDAASKLVAVTMTLGPNPQWGAAATLFDAPFVNNNVAGWPYAASPDGKKFLVRGSADSGEAVPVTVVTNWLANARRAAKQ